MSSGPVMLYTMPVACSMPTWGWREGGGDAVSARCRGGRHVGLPWHGGRKGTGRRRNHRAWGRSGYGTEICGTSDPGGRTPAMADRILRWEGRLRLPPTAARGAGG
jgi:hypothetical protein